MRRRARPARVRRPKQRARRTVRAIPPKIPVRIPDRRRKVSRRPSPHRKPATRSRLYHVSIPSVLMSTPDTCHAYFVVTGSFDPAEITRRVATSPTYSVGLGEPGRYAKAAKCSRWELLSRLETTAPLE